MAIPSTGEISMNLFNTDRGIASGTQIDLAAAGTAYAVSYTTDGTNDLQMLEFRGKSSLYWTATRSGTFTRNNCSAGYTASSVTYTKTYTSYISQANANALASGDTSFNTEGQAYANANGTCTLYLSATTTYGCQSQAPNKGYINVSSYSGGSGAPYSFRYKLESDPDSSYSAWISGTGTTGAILSNGAWMLQIRDSVGNTQNLYSFAISCDYPGISVSIDSGGSYNGNAYIRVYNMSGGSGTGYYWYLSSDAPGTQRANNTYALNLANGSYTPYFGDSRGLQASGNPITFNYPEPPNYLSVTFREGSTAPSSTNGGCSGGTITNLTVEMPTGTTFENAGSYKNSYFTSFPSTVIIGYLIYNGRYVPVGKAYGGTDTVQAFGSRANCPTQVPAYGPVSPAEYQCVSFDKQQKYNDGNGGFTWVSVENPSTYCGYVYRPSISLTFDYTNADACNGTVYTTYYLASTDGGDLRTATELWYYSDGTGYPPYGYYSDGTWSRYWGGTTFSGAAFKCTGGGGIA